MKLKKSVLVLATIAENTRKEEVLRFAPEIFDFKYEK